MVETFFLSNGGLFNWSLCNFAAGCHGESALRLTVRHEFGKKQSKRAGKFLENVVEMFFMKLLPFCFNVNWREKKK